MLKGKFFLQFDYNLRLFKKQYKNVTYYPINIYNSTFKKLKHNLCYSKSDEIEIEHLRNVIDDVLQISSVLPLTGDIISEAVKFEMRWGFDKPDALVYASIVDDLKKTDFSLFSG